MSKSHAVAKSKQAPAPLLPLTQPGEGMPHAAGLAALAKLAELLQLLPLVAPASAPAPIATQVHSPHLGARELVDALLDRVYRPLPKKGSTEKNLPAEVCPASGLKRDALYELFQLRDERGLPVIETVSMREEGEERATRLYNVGSVLRYLRKKARRQVEEERNKNKIS